MIVEHDGETVARQSFCHVPTNAFVASGYDCYSVFGHAVYSASLVMRERGDDSSTKE
jgi:hypothetical protein